MPIVTPIIYQLKITLKHSKPPIWRRILIPFTYTLADLHRVIQVIMENWTDNHLHEFEIKHRYYGDPKMSDSTEFDERKFPLYKILRKNKEKFLYTYDFGDNWEHEIMLEKILKFDPRQQYPFCIAGKRVCPEEDSGGMWGYEYKLKVMRNPKHPEYKELVEWMGEDFDPEKFDKESINEELKRQFKNSLKPE